MPPEAELDVAKRDLESSITFLRDAIKFAQSRGATFSRGIAKALNDHSAARESYSRPNCTAEEILQSTADAEKSARDLLTGVAAGQALDEWKECRSTIDRCDKLLVDLRKTGFGFVTAIVGAATFLFNDSSSKLSWLDVSSNDAAGDKARAALFCMLVLLIVVLYWVDLAHQTWLGVAVERAKTLEQHSLGFKLTGNIGEQFAAARAIGLGLAIYASLLVATFSIFLTAIHNHPDADPTVMISAFVAGLALMLAGHLSSIKRDTFFIMLATGAVLVAAVFTVCKCFR